MNLTLLNNADPASVQRKVMGDEMEVVQVKIVDGVKFVEVLDTDYMDRLFRVVWRDADIRVGDQLWWQLFRGKLTRVGEFEDRDIGRCEPSDALVVNPEFAKEYEQRFRPQVLHP